jgi:uncharacterized protein (TIGR03790 family)
MKTILSALLSALASVTPAIAAPEPIPADQVAILYNSAEPESKVLAETYAKARSIPAANVIALPLSKNEEISRDEFTTSLLTPLRDTFDKKQWWTMGKAQDGTVLSTSSRIKVLVTMRGVPLKIARRAGPAVPPGQSPKSPLDGANEASVDAELALLSVRDLPIDGPARNPFFENKRKMTSIPKSA